MLDAREWIAGATERAQPWHAFVPESRSDLPRATDALTAVLDLLDGPRAINTGHVSTADLRTAITNALEGSTR